MAPASSEPFEVPPGWVLALLRGGPRDGTRVWLQKPPRTIRLAPEDEAEYHRGGADVWWHPSVPDPEPVSEPEQLTLG